MRSIEINITDVISQINVRLKVQTINFNPLTFTSQISYNQFDIWRNLLSDWDGRKDLRFLIQSFENYSTKSIQMFSVSLF